MTDTTPAQTCMTVLYDGDCPLCRREIAVYQGLAANEPVRWVDVSAQGTELPAERSRLMARFHVQREDGHLLSGAEAFLALWARLPGWRWLAFLGRAPGAAWLMERAYVGFLRVRPAMQRVARGLDAPAVPDDMLAELRSDHAGETGAVWIYRGIALVTRDAELKAFAVRHGATEQDHLQRVCEVLPWARRSWLLPAWRVAGFLTGALPALAGPRAVHATIASVETFVDHHYQQQIDRIEGRPGVEQLRALLVECQADEVAHRDEALALQTQPPGVVLRAWCALVGSGSAMAVKLARLI